MHEAQLLVALLPAQHADQAVLAHAVDRVDRDAGRLVHGEPARPAGDHRQVDVEQILVQRRVTDPHLAARPDGSGRSRLHAPGERHPLADRLLDAGARQPRDLLVEELVQPLAALAAPHGIARGRLAHRFPKRQLSARSIWRLASGISTSNSSSTGTHVSSLGPPRRGSPFHSRTRKT